MNKKIIISTSLICIFLLMFYLKQPIGKHINVSKFSIPEYIKEREKVKVDSLFLSIVETGFGEAPEALMYKGGALLKTRKISHIAVLIRHPKGTFVFDTGLGNKIETQFKENISFLDRNLMKFEKKESLKESLIQNNYSPDIIDFIIPSHLHFDHAGGVLDFPKAVVKTTLEEYEHAMSEEASPSGFIKEQYNSENINWEFLNFTSGSYLIYPESHDIFKDGSVILVKLPGHTKGSLGMFVNLPSGTKYFFTGDITSVKEGFILPAEKHPMFRSLVDFDREETKNTIVSIHHLMKINPEIKIIPAHDYDSQKEIAQFPEFER